MFAGQYWIGSGSPRRTTGGDFGLVRSQRGSSRSLGLDSWRTRRRAGCVRGQHWRRTNLPAGPPPVLRAGGGGPSERQLLLSAAQGRGGEISRTERGMSHPILGTVPQLTGVINWVKSQPVNLCNVCPALSSDTGSTDTDSRGEEVAGTSTEAPLPPVMHPTEDFSLEQSRDDTLRSAYDQVIDIDGLLVHPEASRTYTHFQLRNDRLYRVSLDTRTNEICTQLLVPQSRRETFSRRLIQTPWQGI